MKKIFCLTVLILAVVLSCAFITACGDHVGMPIPGINTSSGTSVTDKTDGTSKTVHTTTGTAAPTAKPTLPTDKTTETTKKTTSTSKATSATTVVPKNITIFLDPGHGGSDPGVVRTYGGVEYHESDINLEVALIAKKELEKRGYTVVMSRETDKWVNLDSRAPMAQKAGADMFVSVHVNSFHDTSVAGTRVYYTKRTGLSYNAYNFAEFFRKEFEDIRSIESSTNPGNLAYPNMKKVRIGSDEDLYGKGGYLAVLAATDIPSVLIELGFITNENDFLMLKSQWWQLYAARAIADAVDAAYAKGVYAK